MAGGCGGGGGGRGGSGRGKQTLLNQMKEHSNPFENSLFVSITANGNGPSRRRELDHRQEFAVHQDSITMPTTDRDSPNHTG